MRILPLLLMTLLLGSCVHEKTTPPMPPSPPSPPPMPVPAPPPPLIYTPPIIPDGPIIEPRALPQLPDPIGGGVVERPNVTTPQPTIGFEDVFAQFGPAAFGYTVPNDMNVDEVATVTLIVNPSKTIEEITREIGGDSVTGEMLVSRILTAEISSSDFDITKLTPARQAVDDDQNTEWKWNIKPRGPGASRQFTISVSALVYVYGEKTERFIDTYHGRVNVHITPKQQANQWISQHWQWAWGALLVPLGGWFWAFRRKRRLTD